MFYTTLVKRCYVLSEYPWGVLFIIGSLVDNNTIYYIILFQFKPLNSITELWQVRSISSMRNEIWMKEINYVANIIDLIRKLIIYSVFIANCHK